MPKPTEKAAKPAEDPKAKAAAPEPEPPAEPVVPAEEPEEKEEPAEPEEPPAPIEGKDDPLLASIFADLKDEKEPEFKKVEEEPETPAAPAAEEPPTTEEPAAEPAKKPKKQSRVITEPPAPPGAPVVIAPPVAPVEPPKPAVDPEAEYIASLNDDQREELSEARKAEAMFPERYKGREKKLLQWFKDLDTTATRLQAENPDRTFDEQDTDFQKFLKTKPAITPLDSKKVQRQLVEESVTTKLRSEQDVKNAEIERRQKAIELKPEIDKVENELRTGLTNAIEGEVGDLIRKEGFAKAKEQFPLDAAVLEQTLNEAAELTREYTSFARGITKFDAQNPKHKWLYNFVIDQGRVFAKSGGKDRIDEQGRQFLPRDQFAQMVQADPQANDKYWTFTHRRVIEMIGINAKQDAEQRIKNTEAEAKRLGFERPTRKVSADPKKQDEVEKPEPKPITAPKAGVKPTKGAATTKGKEPPAGDGINIVEALGLRS